MLGILVLAGIFFFRPCEYIDGGWDPGGYINTGVHIGKTGNLLYKDTMLEGAGDNIKQYLVSSMRSDGSGARYPGLYVKNADKGLLVPQFFYLYPVWIAVFYLIAGIKSVFFVNSFFALGSVVLVFFIVRAVIGKPYGFIAALILSLNVIEIWNARFSTAEVLGQFLLLSGFYLWIRYLEEGKKIFGFFSGMAIGEFLFINITSIIIVPVVIMYFLYRLKKKDLCFIIPFALLSLQLMYQFTTFSSLYVESVIRFFRFKEIIIVAIGFSFICALVLFFRRYDFNKFRIPAVIFSILLFVYGYFLRPIYSHSFEKFNMFELSNYISVAGLFIAFIGFLFMVYRENKTELWFIMLAAFVSAVFFIYSKRMFWRYPFCLRRYVPIVVPFYAISLVYILKLLNSKLRRFGKVFSTIGLCAIVAVPIYKNKDMILVRDFHDSINFCKEIAGDMKDEALYLASNHKWARPLADIYGKKVLVVREGGVLEIAKENLQKGREVYYITHSEKPYSMELDFSYSGKYSMKTSYLEHSLKFPQKKKNVEIVLFVYKMQNIKESENQSIVDIGSNGIGLLGGWDRVRKFRDKKTGEWFSARWTTGEAKIVIPYSIGIDRRIILRAKGMPPEAGETKISLIFGDKKLAEDYHIDSEFKEYVFVIPAGYLNVENKHRGVLTIQSNTWDPMDCGIKGYPENCGILIDWIEIKG